MEPNEESSAHQRPEAPCIACKVAEQLSVIIPALNEEQNIAAAICSTRAGLQGCTTPPEVIVVDGGSTDSTVKAAQKAGCKVIHSERGRGRQLNAGWQGAAATACNRQHQQKTGKQQICERDATEHQQQQQQQQPLTVEEHTGKGHSRHAWWCWQPWSVQHRPAKWGCFMTIHTEWCNSWQGSLLAAGVKLRTRLLGQPYGDQALFATRELLHKVGGLPDWKLLEDVELVKRLRKASHSRPYIVPMPIHTSGRRWESLGFWRTALLNQAVLIGWSCGVPPDDLATWYYSARKSKQSVPPAK